MNEWEKQFEEEAIAEVQGLSLAPVSISTRGGVLQIDKVPLKGNKFLACIVADTGFNAFYTTAYNPSEIVAPDCFAYGPKDEEMMPHELVANPAHDNCRACPNNQWGSAVVGRGKRCSNKRNLGLIIVGTWDAEQSAYIVNESVGTYEGPVHVLTIPPTSLTALNKYKVAMSQQIKRPLRALITEIELLSGDVPKFRFTLNDKVGYDVDGQPLENAAEIYEVISRRQQEFLDIIQKPYAENEKGSQDGPKKY